MLKLILTLLCLSSLTYMSAVNLTYEKVLRNLRGLRSYQQGEYSEARHNFEENIVNYPGEGALHYNLGNTFFREGNLDDALAEYQRALRDDRFPLKSNTYQNMGNALFEQKDYKEALESYRNALISNPDNSDARYNYELTRLMLQEMSEEEQPQPQSGDGDEGDDEDEQEQQQQQQADAEPTDEDSEDAEEAEIVQTEEGEGDDPEESDPELERKLEEAEDILRTLMAREKELLEEKREREREGQVLEGKFW